MESQAVPAGQGVQKVFKPLYTALPGFRGNAMYVPRGQLVGVTEPTGQYAPRVHGPPVVVSVACTALVAPIVQKYPALQNPVGDTNPGVSQ